MSEDVVETTGHYRLFKLKICDRVNKNYVAVKLTETIENLWQSGE